MKGFGKNNHSKKRKKYTLLNQNKYHQILNQATQYQSQGNITQAIKLYEFLIEKGFNESLVFANYGIILINSGRLKDAILSINKAIALNPKDATLHSNLGGILRELGKLEEAELSTRKAIELKPDFANAHLNLGSILSDLGKLKELLTLSESTLGSESINQGYKLVALLRITITQLIQNDFSVNLLNINKTNGLINQGAINLITDKKLKKYVYNYSKFITSLYPLLKKNNSHSDSNKIPHFGESHCLSFAHQSLSISSQVKKIQPVLVTGGKAWHFANTKNNRWKNSLSQQIKKHTYSDTAFISFGEIDCRKDEGIINYAIKNGKDISEVCEKTIQGYLDYMEKNLSPTYSKKYFFGVPAPKREKKFLDELDIKRIKIIKIYNFILKKEVLLRGSYFVDVYALTSNQNGENNNLYICDNNHLSPECLSKLFEQCLYKTDQSIEQV